MPATKKLGFSYSLIYAMVGIACVIICYEHWPVPVKILCYKTICVGNLSVGGNPGKPQDRVFVVPCAAAIKIAIFK